MKLTHKIIVLGLLIGLFSCSSDDEGVIYDGDSSEQTLIRIGQSSYTIEVDEEGEGNATLTVLSSTKQDEDRTFDIEELSTTDDLYDNAEVEFDDSVTIPAGEYIGEFDVNITNSTIEDAETIELGIVELDDDNIVFEKNQTTITIVPE